MCHADSMASWCCFSLKLLCCSQPAAEVESVWLNMHTSGGIWSARLSPIGCCSRLVHAHKHQIGTHEWAGDRLGD
jgi:hypothetical protein